MAPSFARNKKTRTGPSALAQPGILEGMWVSCALSFAHPLSNPDATGYNSRKYSLLLVDSKRVRRGKIRLPLIPLKVSSYPEVFSLSASYIHVGFPF